ncbi:MAG: WYL domain-containing protein, partial [Cellulomonadaceae bacterium]|nr:WYL domain-containing protein [Cellulomonadaceae bacterium]
NADVAAEAATHREFTTTLVLASGARWLAEELPGQATKLPDGTFRLTIPATSRAWIVRLLLGIAPLVKSIEPADIGAEVAQLARQALENYP